MKSLNLKKIIVIFISMVLLCACTSNEMEIQTTEKLEVHYINVGQADSILLTNSNQAMLVDAGDTDAAEIIIPYLNTLGIKKLDVVLFTHPHKDHIGSGYKIIESFDIGKVYMSDKITTTNTFEKLLDSIELKNIDLIVPMVGDKIEFGNCDVTVLGPTKEYEDINDNSIVINVEYFETSFLLTGDMETTSEKDIIDSNLNLDADVLKIAHHGSRTSSSDVFLEMVSPEYAVISCGIDNDYNHPHMEVLERLNKLGVEVFRTDEMGTIVATSDGKNITFDKEGINTNLESNDKNQNSSQAITYIGNINSKKFHLESCKSLPAEKNRVFFANRDEATQKGYGPCSQCNP